MRIAHPLFQGLALASLQSFVDAQQVVVNVQPIEIVCGSSVFTTSFSTYTQTLSSTKFGNFSTTTVPGGLIPSAVTGSAATPGGPTPVTVYTPPGASYVTTSVPGGAVPSTVTGDPASPGAPTPVTVYTPPGASYVTTSVPGGAIPSTVTGDPTTAGGPTPVTVYTPPGSYITTSVPGGAVPSTVTGDPATPGGATPVTVYTPPGNKYVTRTSVGTASTPYTVTTPPSGRGQTGTVVIYDPPVVSSASTGTPVTPGETTPVTIYTPPGYYTTFITSNVTGPYTSTGTPLSSGGSTPVFIFTPVSRFYLTTTVPGGPIPSTVTGTPSYPGGTTPVTVYYPPSSTAYSTTTEVGSSSVPYTVTGTNTSGGTIPVTVYTPPATTAYSTTTEVGSSSVPYTVTGTPATSGGTVPVTVYTPPATTAYSTTTEVGSSSVPYTVTGSPSTSGGTVPVTVYTPSSTTPAQTSSSVTFSSRTSVTSSTSSSVSSSTSSSVSLSSSSSATSSSSSSVSSSTSSSTTSTNPGPTFSCDAGGYLIQSQTLYRLNLTTNVQSTVNTAVGNYSVNAIGYNVEDNYLFGIQGTDNKIIRINSQGIATVVGQAPTGVFWNLGDIDTAGRFWISASGGRWAQIDLMSGSSTFGQVVASGESSTSGLDGTPSDWVYLPSQGQYLYTVTQGTNAQLARWSLTDHTWSVVRNLGNVDGRTTTTVNQFGALYAVGGDTFYASDNGSGTLYKFNVTSGASSIVATGNPTSQNDGARCVNAPPTTSSLTTSSAPSTTSSASLTSGSGSATTSSVSSTVSQCVRPTCGTGVTRAQYPDPFDNEGGFNERFNTTYYKQNTPQNQTIVTDFSDIGNAGGNFLSYEYTTFVYSCQGGSFSFEITNADDIGLAWFGDTACGDFQKSNNQTYASYSGGPGNVVFTTTLQPQQYYPIRLIFANAGGPASLNVNVSGPNGTVVNELFYPVPCDGSNGFQPFGTESATGRSCLTSPAATT